MRSRRPQGPAIGAPLTPCSAADRQLRRQIIRRRNRAGQVRDLGILALVIGGVLVLAGWGSWRVAIGVGFTLVAGWAAGRLPDHFYR